MIDDIEVNWTVVDSEGHQTTYQSKASKRISWFSKISLK